MSNLPLPNSEKVLALVSPYPNLQKVVKFLMEKTKSPLTDKEEKREAELILKDIRLLVRRAKLEQNSEEKVA